MEEFVRTVLENTSGFPAYAIVFAVLLACGLGVPLPEDVALITGGFLAYTENVELIPMMLVGFGGILVGDSLIYLAGYRVGVNTKNQGFFSRILTPEKRDRVQALFKKHGEKMVFVARFMPGVRAVMYFSAGSAHMSYRRFIAFDGLAALISAPVFVYLGYYFGADLASLIHKIRNGQTRVLIAVAVVVGGYLVWEIRKRRRVAAAKAALAATSVASVPAAPSVAEAPLQAPQPDGK